MTYAEALRYIYHLTDYSQPPAVAYAATNYNLDRLRRLLDLLGRPQDRFRAVQVAGTKGKGSTATMLATMLQAAGQRTGLYTSPHLHTFRERIRVGQDLISEETLARLTAVIAPAVDLIHETPAWGRITTFEVATALAFLHFAQAGVDVAVLEAGLGGRLDATNVVDPILSVITPISRDHTAILGDTLAAIAGEKAGIIKPGVPAIIAPQPAEARAVFEKTCQERGAPRTQVGTDWTWQVRELTPAGLWFDVLGPQQTWSNLHTPLIGAFQALNATTAIAAAAHLGLDEHAIRRGLAAVRWPARVEVLARQPWVIVDSAHNDDSARKLASTLREVFQPRHVILVLGLSQGHQVADMLEALLPQADHVIATQPSRPRVISAAEIQAAVAAQGRTAIVAETVPQALAQALAQAGPDDLICALALFVAAEVRVLYGALGSEHRDPVDGERG